MVIERRNFQRVYDLTHRVMPDWDDERDLVSQAEAEIIMLDNSARSTEYSRTVAGRLLPAKRPALAAWREARAEQQQIIAVHVEKWAIFGCMLILLRRYSSVRSPESSLQRTARTFALRSLLSGIANARSSF